MEYWKRLAATAQGYSPSTETLTPEPRVLMRYTPRHTSPSRPLPQSRLTLQLHDTPLEAALRSLGAAANLSILISPEVSGTVSLAVRNAPWADVFTGLLAAHGLEYQWEGSLLRIVTLAEKRRDVERETLENQMRRQQYEAQQHAPQSLCVVRVRYADAKALQETLNAMLAATPQADRTPALVARDDHSNALIIQATHTEQQRLVALVESLDRPRPQVYLKAYIVEASKDTARELGVQWGGVWRSPAVGNNHLWAGSGMPAPSSGNPLPTPYNNGLGGVPYGLDFSPDVANMGSVQFMLGRLGGNMLEAQLNMLEKDGQLNILSSPSLTTLDNKMAYTENGQKVPYVATSALGDREVRFEDAVLRLEMTPNVIDAQNLKLSIQVRKDEVDTSRSVEGNPFIIKKQTATTLVVRHGETVVISGLTKEKNTTVNTGVPERERLPAGRFLLGHESRGSTLEEVLIFITPYILPVRKATDTAAIGAPADSAIPSPNAGAPDAPQPDPLDRGQTTAPPFMGERP